MRWFDGIADSMEMSLSKLSKIVKNRKAWCAAVHRVAQSWTRQKRLSSSSSSRCWKRLRAGGEEGEKG